MARIIRRPPNVNQFGSTLELFRLKKFFRFLNLFLSRRESKMEPINAGSTANTGLVQKLGSMDRAKPWAKPRVSAKLKIR